MSENICQFRDFAEDVEAVKQQGHHWAYAIIVVQEQWRARRLTPAAPDPAVAAPERSVSTNGLTDKMKPPTKWAQWVSAPQHLDPEIARGNSYQGVWLEEGEAVRWTLDGGGRVRGYEIIEPVTSAKNSRGRTK